MLLSSIKHIAILLTFFVIHANNAVAQYHPLLDNFEVQESNGKIYISCVVKLGSTCLGIGLHRSTDNVNFELVGRIPGICGSVDEPISYDFIDTNIIYNIPVYYKIELGGFGFSESIMLQIINFGGSNFQVKPNPANTTASIYFENKLSEKVSLVVLNSQGTVLHSSTTNSSQFELDLSSYTDGVYTFYISNRSIRAISGKIIKVQ